MLHRIFDKYRFNSFEIKLKCNHKNNDYNQTMNPVTFELVTNETKDGVLTANDVLDQLKTYTFGRIESVRHLSGQRFSVHYSTMLYNNFYYQLESLEHECKDTSIALVGKFKDGTSLFWSCYLP